MKLWLLQAREDLGDNPKRNPWEPWYDRATGFVVRAETEEQAREIATENAGDETVRFGGVWKSSEYSTCVELSADGEADMILRDYNRA